MIKNYFKIALRNLWKNKGYSAINIFGLAIGLATCLLITLYVTDELSYDRYNEKPIGFTGSIQICVLVVVTCT